jgi:hypothetical protein
VKLASEAAPEWVQSAACRYYGVAKENLSVFLYDLRDSSFVGMKSQKSPESLGMVVHAEKRPFSMQNP